MLFSLKVALPLWAVVMVMSHGAIASDDHDPLEAVVQQLAQKVEQLEARVDARMTGFETELQELHKLEPTVVFSVYHSSRHFSVANHAPILFDSILLNQGGGYSPAHGEFTAPVSGLYFLGFRGWTNADHACWLQLWLNGSNVITEAAVGDGDYESSSSQWVVEQLQQGDRVEVKVVNGVGSGAVALAGQHRTTFSGFLLRAD